MGLFGKEDSGVTLKKYYMEVIGASKELYTVKANHVSLVDGCYRFYLNDEVVAMYPIVRTIIKSIEEKHEA
jgi:hypothetical protein